MATSSVKVLVLVTILLAVFAQEAVEAKTHFLYWEVSPQSTSQLLKTCKKIFQCLLSFYILAVVKLLKQSRKHPFLFLFLVELYTHLPDQYWRHMQILTHSFVLLFFSSVVFCYIWVHKPLVASRRKVLRCWFDMLSVTCCRLRTQHIPQIVTL
jgi:hypothetical protein